MASEYIFLNDSYDQDGKVLVAKADWFKDMPICETYDNYGQQVACETAEGNDGECCCVEVKAYNYWNGSNYASAIIEAADFDTRYTEITDEEEVARYTKALEEKEYDGERTGYVDYKADGLIITQSSWQGDWELFTIQEDEEGSDDE